MSARADTMTRRLAGWIYDFAGSAFGPATAERTRGILLDTVACALAASTDELARPIMRSLPRLGGNRDCTIIGSRARSALPVAAFCNSALIRLLDLNDTYTGRRQVGHPSDNIGLALAAAEMQDRSGADLIRAVRLGYEIYGRLIDLGDPESPWDHVSVSGLVVAGMAGWLFGLPVDRLADALALAAMHCATLGEVRVGRISSAKAIANSAVVHTASLLTLLAAEGLTGPEQALEGRRGYAKLVLGDVDFEGFFKGGAEDRVLSVGIKQYPCFSLGQGPISAAIALRSQLPQPDSIERLRIVLADTSPARLRLSDQHGRKPASSEAADHSVYFLVAAALLDGRFGLDQLRGGRWRDRDIGDLIDRTEAVIDPTLLPRAAFPCRLEAVLKTGGRVVVERPCTPGFASLPLSWEQLTEKFERCARDAIGDKARRDVVARIADIERQPSIRTLLGSLTPDGPAAT